MNHRITADFTTLMDQAPTTINCYMMDAHENIDNEFGEGYAEKHPELVGTYIQACSMDFVGAVLAKTLGDSMEFLSSTVSSLESTVAHFER